MFQREQGIRYKAPSSFNSQKTVDSANIDDDGTFYDSRIGGILAEEMGSGKTLICIMLILASKYLRVEMPGHVLQRPQPLELPEVKRPMALVPSLEVAQDEERIEDNEGISDPTEIDRNSRSPSPMPIEPPEPPSFIVPSLLTLATRALMTSGTPWEDRTPYTFQRERYRTLMNTQRNLHKWGSYQVTKSVSSRLAANKDTTDVYLSGATLVVVPGNLVIQWEDEVLKHSLAVEEGGVRYLRVNDSGVIPTVEEMLDVDMVLISRRRFDIEIKDGTDEYGRRRVVGVQRACGCDLWTSSKKGICRCPKEEGFYSSPLMGIHWKRIIVDEGHSMASSKSNSVLVAGMLRVESKWIVTGTPSSGLYSKNPGNSEADDNSIRISEATDLRRIGEIVTHFLRLPPYDNKKHRWPNKVADALSSGTLRRVLEQVMIRHQISDIEAEISLPPLHQKIVFIKPGFYEKLSINLFLAQMASNEVTSERCDQDWFFHHTQRKHLNDFVNNIRECAFYWTSMNRRSIMELRDTARKYLDQDKVKLVEDQILLRRVVEVAEMALASEIWTTCSIFHDMGKHLDLTSSFVDLILMIPL